MEQAGTWSACEEQKNLLRTAAATAAAAAAVPVAAELAACSAPL